MGTSPSCSRRWYQRNLLCSQSLSAKSGAWRHPLHRFERRERLPGDEMIRAGKAQIVVFGMGRVGTGAYDYLRSKWGEVVLGIDIDQDCVERHRQAGRDVMHGDATDADFWARAERSGRVKLALLAFADHEENMAVASLLREQGFNLELASVAHYPTTPTTNSHCAVPVCTPCSTSTPMPGKASPSPSKENSVTLSLSTGPSPHVLREKEKSCD